MSAGWVAATVRGRALLRGVLGPAQAREIAGMSSWPDARGRLAGTGYGTQLAPEADRESARRAAVEATLWQLRVLAGWLPPGGTTLARLAAAPIEIANIEGHLSRLIDQSATTPFALGSLGVAWPRVADTVSPEQLRGMLTSSVWGDPGGSDRPALALGLRVSWACRLARAAPVAGPVTGPLTRSLTGPWTAGAVAMLVAREQLAFGRPVPAVTARQVDQVLGHGWRDPSSVGDLARGLPDQARWVLDGIESPEDLWRAEVALIARVHTDAQPAATSGRYGRESVLAVLALTMADLWRATAAIEAAGRGPGGSEVFDALAS